MKDNKNNIWFPAKKYGIGWGLPVTWQGWFVLLLYVVFLIIGVNMLTGTTTGIPFVIAYLFILTALLVFICWKKGEKFDFHRGKKLK